MTRDFVSEVSVVNGDHNLFEIFVGTNLNTDEFFVGTNLTEDCKTEVNLKIMLELYLE